MDTYLPTGQVSFTYKHFAVLGPDSTRAAEASVCAAEQNKFWEYADTLFQQRSQGAFTAPNLKKYAGQVGLDTNAFQSCVDSGRGAAQAATDMNEGKQYGFKGVPTMVINGQVTEGLAPVSVYKGIIDGELQK